MASNSTTLVMSDLERRLRAAIAEAVKRNAIEAKRS